MLYLTYAVDNLLINTYSHPNDLWDAFRCTYKLVPLLPALFQPIWMLQPFLFFFCRICSTLKIFRIFNRIFDFSGNFFQFFFRKTFSVPKTHLLYTFHFIDFPSFTSSTIMKKCNRQILFSSFSRMFQIYCSE